MLSIEEMINMAKQMNIGVSEESDGKHYILNSDGVRVPFQVNMLMDNQSQISYKESFKVNFHKNHNFTDLKEKYIVSNDCSTGCISEPIDVEQSDSLVA